LIGLIALVSVLDFLKLDAAAGAVVSGHHHLLRGRIQNSGVRSQERSQKHPS
jgi:hypothetical protein